MGISFEELWLVYTNSCTLTLLPGQHDLTVLFTKRPANARMKRKETKPEMVEPLEDRKQTRSGKEIEETAPRKGRSRQQARVKKNKPKTRSNIIMIFFFISQRPEIVRKNTMQHKSSTVVVQKSTHAFDLSSTNCAKSSKSHP